MAGLRAGILLVAVLAALAPGVRSLVRVWRTRVAVVGTSMSPTLEPGDWLLVDEAAYRRRAPRPGELVVAGDPRQTARALVKRVVAVDADGRLELAGDAPNASTDSRTFGPLDPAAIGGRPWFRIHPRTRLGRVG
jgi:nickel-type superoxide dismutase maturation protease